MENKNINSKPNISRNTKYWDETRHSLEVPASLRSSKMDLYAKTYRVSSDGKLIYLPSNCIVLKNEQDISEILEKIHQQGHFGINHVERVAREQFLFNNFRYYVQIVVCFCFCCFCFCFCCFAVICYSIIDASLSILSSSFAFNLVS